MLRVVAIAVLFQSLSYSTYATENANQNVNVPVFVVVGMTSCWKSECTMCPKNNPNCIPAPRTQFSEGPKISAGPKRGSLTVGAWNPQESGRGVPLFCNAAFLTVAMQFSFVAAQLLGKSDVRTAEKRMLQCSFCSATFRKLQRNFCFIRSFEKGLAERGLPS